MKKCITGYSKSNYCGAAAYCDEPYNCCAECNNSCNVRCGWLPKKQETEEKKMTEYEDWDWDEYFDCEEDNVIFDDDCQFYFVFDGKTSKLVLFNPPDHYYYCYDADEDE